MRTTLTIDDDVYQAALAISRSSGERVGKVISDLMRRALKPYGEARIVQEGRFPVIVAPEGTPMINAEELERIIDEEGF